MGARVIEITVEASCDSLFCNTPPRWVTAATEAEANTALRGHGWSTRRLPYVQWECPACTTLTAHMLKVGALVRDPSGMLLIGDRALWEKMRDADRAARGVVL